MLRRIAAIVVLAAAVGAVAVPAFARTRARPAAPAAAALPAWSPAPLWPDGEPALPPEAAVDVKVKFSFRAGNEPKAIEGRLTAVYRATKAAHTFDDAIVWEKAPTLGVTEGDDGFSVDWKEIGRIDFDDAYGKKAGIAGTDVSAAVSCAEVSDESADRRECLLDQRFTIKLKKPGANKAPIFGDERLPILFVVTDAAGKTHRIVWFAARAYVTNRRDESLKEQPLTKWLNDLWLRQPATIEFK